MARTMTLSHMGTTEQALADDPRIHSHRAAYAYAQLPAQGYDVLDFGCADGYNANLWRKDGNRVVGVDIKTSALEKARARYSDLSFVPSGDRLPFEDCSFDFVVMLDVIEHVNDERAVLREIERVLRPGGRLILTTPFRNVLGDWMDQDNLFFNPAIRLSRLIRGREMPRNLRHRHYNLADITRLAGSGFEVERVDMTGGPDTFALALIAKATGLVSERVFGRRPEALESRISAVQRKTHVRNWGPLAAKINLVLRRVASPQS